MESSKGTLAGMGRPTGLEPATPGTTNQCSNRLSYGRHAHQAERTYVPLSQASRTATANPVSEAVFDGSRVVIRASSRWMRRQEIGRASCRERVCQDVQISEGAGSIIQKNKNKTR